MGDMAEDRVYDERAGSQLVFAASSRGVATVETSGDTVGRFRLSRECDARDLAGAEGRLAVATPEDVLVAEVVDEGPGEWVETGFGPAVAVGFEQDDLLAAAPDGAIGRVLDPAADPSDWLDIADVDGAVRAIDGPLVGASDGVYRLTADGIVDVGLEDVRDVSAAGAPLAATGDGLFRLGNGWLRELDGAVDVVAATDRPAGSTDDPARDPGDRAGNADDPARDPGDRAGNADDPAGTADPPSEDGVLARGHAAAGDQLYAYAGEGSDPEEPVDEDDVLDPAVAARAWRERATPAGPVVDVAYGERTYALSADGTLLLDRGADWETRALGLPDPVALATPE